ATSGGQRLVFGWGTIVKVHL
ncbi:rCG64445, partial [Rattus norvegicus]